jgi:hypothetical protein
MNEVQINKIKKRADEYATSCFPYEKQFLEREAVVKCCVHVVTETIAELEKENAELKEQISIKDILIKELQEQKVYWKESSFDWRHKFFKLDKVKRLIKKDKELAKAKDLLKWALHSDPEHDGDFEKKWEEAKQFLKEK